MYDTAAENPGNQKLLSSMVTASWPGCRLVRAWQDVSQVMEKGRCEARLLANSAKSGWCMMSRSCPSPVP